MPTRWYNLVHDLPTPPPPPLHPGTGQPVGPDDLAAIFPMDLIAQEVTDRAVRRHPAGGAGRLPAVAALPALPGPPAREGPRHPGPHLLQVRGRLARRLAQAEHRGAAGLLQRQGRHPEADHRDRRRPVGHRTGVRLRAVRPRVRGLAGARVVRRQALPQDHDGDLRQHRAPEPLRPHRGRPGDARPRRRLPRLARARDQRGGRDGGPGPHGQLRARLGPQPRAAAPDDHRRGGPAPAGQGRRERRPDRRLHRRRLELRRAHLPLPPGEARGGWRRAGHPGGGAGLLPQPDPGHLRLRLRRRRGPHAAAQDAHAGPRLHPRPDPRRRPALPRDEPAHQPPLRARA